MNKRQRLWYGLLRKLPYKQRSFLIAAGDATGTTKTNAIDELYNAVIRYRFVVAHYEIFRGTCKCGYRFDPLRDREWRDHADKMMQEIRDEIWAKRRFW